MSSGRRRLPLVRLAWRNMRRNTRRTLLTVSAVAVAVAAVTFFQAYVDGIMGNVVDSYARTQSGHVRVLGEGYTARERFLPLHLNVHPLSALLPTIRDHPAVEDAIPRIRTAALADGAGSNRPAMLLGIDLEREGRYLQPEEMVVEGALPRPGQPEIMMGRELAEKLTVGIGDTLTLLGQTAYRSLGGGRFTVTAISQFGMAYFDATFLLAPLDQVQAMTYLDDASTEILVFLHDPARADSVASALAVELKAIADDPVEVRSWQDEGSLLRLMETAKPILAFIMGLLLLMAGLIIVNTMLMTIMERTHEFGMQAALGMRRRDIVLLIVAEGAAIGVVGAVAGAVLGSGVGLWLEQAGIDLTAATRGIDFPMQGVVYPHWQASHVVVAMLIGIATAGVAALYPAWRAVRLAPAEALRA